MKLKIKIKEVKEETRELTIEERCMYNISKNGIKDGYIPDLISNVNNRLKEIGFIEAMYDKQIPAEILREVKGLFRTETIRDATQEEIIAWHGRSVMDICSKTEYLGVFEHIRHIPAGDEWIKAKELLEGKEVILSVPEE